MSRPEQTKRDRREVWSIPLDQLLAELRARRPAPAPLPPKVSR